MNNASIVNKHYKDNTNLSVSMSLHQKYSTNKYGNTNWVFIILQFFDSFKVLELGYGNGDMWVSRMQHNPNVQDR